jgi:sarcosine oxidase gamma subunit
VTGDRIAVISQVSSALWLGHLAPDEWSVTGAGTSYALPRDADGNIVYGTAEGVSWIAPDQLVMCSDKAKPEQHPRCQAKDQSIHIFSIPGSARP